MFVRVKKIGGYEYLYLVENAREGGRHVQRVIKALGRRDEVADTGLLDGLIASAARHSRRSIVLSSFYRGELAELRRQSIGPDLVFGHLWRETGCQAVLRQHLPGRRFGFDVERAIYLTVLHRLMVSGSDRHASTWQQTIDIPGVEALTLDHAYKAMAWLGETIDGTDSAQPRHCTDDTIVGFKRHADADRFLRDLRERLATIGLALHPDKTRLIEFGRFAAQRRSVKGLRKPETFDFLGFTQICGKRPDGAFILLRQTIAKRMRAKLLEIKETLYRMCHLPVPEQGRWLGQVLRGYFAYHAVPTNSRRTTAFAFHVVRHWRRALMRRSQKAYVPWRRMKPIAARWIPSTRIRHPWPQQRFLVKYPRGEPSALAAHARICPGGAG